VLNRPFRKLLALLWMALWLPPPVAWSDFQSGGQLLQNCTQENNVQAQAYCIGYIAAIADVLGRGEEDISGWWACLPSNATQGDVVEVAASWLKEHPSVHDAGASDIVAHALSRAYPCTP
jgi:hypothetical protein